VAEAPIGLNSVGGWVVPAWVQVGDLLEQTSLDEGKERRATYQKMARSLSTAARYYMYAGYRARITPSEWGLEETWWDLLGKEERSFKYSTSRGTGPSNGEMGRHKLRSVQTALAELTFPWDAWNERASIDAGHVPGPVALRVLGLLKTEQSARRIHAEREVFCVIDVLNQGETSLTDCFLLVEITSTGGYSRRVMHFIPSWKPGSRWLAKYPVVEQEFLSQIAPNASVREVSVRYLSREQAGAANGTNPFGSKRFQVGEFLDTER